MVNMQNPKIQEKKNLSSYGISRVCPISFNWLLLLLGGGHTVLHCILSYGT